MRTAFSSCLCLLSLCTWVQAQTSQRQSVIDGFGSLSSSGTVSQVSAAAQSIGTRSASGGALVNFAGFLSPLADDSVALLDATKSYQLLVDADGDGKPSPGDTLRYTISVSNNGVIDAEGVQLIDVVTTNTLMTVTNSVTIKPVAGGDGYDATSGVQLVVSTPGVLDNDSDLDSTPNPISVGSSDAISANGGAVNVFANGGFTYLAAPGFSGTDTFRYEVTDGLATDSATVTISVAEVADLSVTKSDDVDPVSNGATLTYTIIVSNAGPTVASEVTVTDALPAGVTLQMASGDFACSNPAPGVVICTGGPLAAGTTATISIPVTPNVSGATLTNTVTVSTTAIDGNPGNDTATEETSVNANDPPVAADDSYSTFGNVRLTIDMTSGVLSNDADPNMDMLVVSNFDTNSALTGVVAVATNGSFTYDPPAGVQGTDSWTYVVSDGVATDTGTVTVVIGGPTVWFVDNRVAGPGTGTQADPFNDLSSLQGSLGVGDTDQPGDVIFMFEGTGAAYTGGLDLEADQRLVGEPAGLTLSGNVIVPAAGDRPRITHTAEATKLGTNVELDSVVFDSTGNFGISGFNFGTLTMNNVSAISQGRGSVFLSTGTANLTGITCTSSNSTTEGLTLLSIDGDVQIVGGSIASANGAAVRITGGSADITVACSIVNNTGSSVQILNRTGGSVTLSGAITDTGSGIVLQNNSGGSVTFSGAGKVLNTGSSTAVNLNNNTGATINFTTGTLDIDTTSGTGFSATGGGTINVSGPNNTITTTTGAGAVISGVTLGATFASISAGGGIDFDNNAGSFTSSGGTVSKTSGSTVTVDGGTATYNLNNMNISRSGGRVFTVGRSSGAGGAINFGGTSKLIASGGDFGIRVDGSSAAITIAEVEISNTVLAATAFDSVNGRPLSDGAGDAIFLKNNAGSFTVNGGTINDVADNAVDVRNSNNTVLNNVTIEDGSDGNSFSTANSAIQWHRGSNLTLRGVTLRNTGDNTVIPTASVNIQDSGLKALDVAGDLIIEDCLFDTATGYVFANAVSGSEDRAVELDNDVAADMNVTVTGSTFRNWDFQGLNLRHIGGSLDAIIGGTNVGDPNVFQNINGAAIDTGPSQQSASGNVHGLLVQDNTFTTVGIGVSVFSARGNSIGGVAGTHVFIRDNIIAGTTSDALRLQAFAVDGGAPLGGSQNPVFRATVTGNRITGVANQLNSQGGGSAFFVAAEDNADSDVTIDGNPQITGGGAATNNFQGAITTQNQRSGDLDVIFTNNDIDNMPGALNGFGVGFFGQDLTVAGTRTAIRFGGNDWNNQIAGFFETVFFDAGIGTMDVQGYSGGPMDAAALVNYLNTIDSNVATFGFTINSGNITGGNASVTAPSSLPTTP